TEEPPERIPDCRSAAGLPCMVSPECRAHGTTPQYPACRASGRSQQHCMAPAGNRSSSHLGTTPAQATAARPDHCQHAGCAERKRMRKTKQGAEAPCCSRERPVSGRTHLLLHCVEIQFDAAVHGSPFSRRIVCHRVIGATPLGHQSATIHPAGIEVIRDCIGTVHRQSLVHLSRPRAIGMTDCLSAQFRMLNQCPSDTIQDWRQFGLQIVLARVEGDVARNIDPQGASGISVTSTPRLAAPDCSTSFFTPDQLYPAMPPATAPIPAPMAAARLLSPIRAPRPAPNAAPVPAPTAVRPPCPISPVAQPAASATAPKHAARRVIRVETFISFSFLS